ncbi:MAG TPA: DHA2 family efflux MFS transporter permease subunit [Solirubrobacteraceae bacterium]|jgi:EmrB/QacA subfamily drug resistance transporter
MAGLSQLRARRGDATPSLVLVIVCAGVVLASLDLFIVNVALPAIARDLHAHSLSDLSWVLNAYAIVYAALLVIFGRLAESRRRENGFLLGVLVFTIGSAACGLATSLPMLVAFRIVQAAGAALLTPTSLSLILATSAPERRPGAVRAWAAIGGLAAALGPVVGGLLVAASWRWVFLVNVPIGVVAIAVGWRRLPRVDGHPVRRPDALGAALVTTGTAVLTLGLVKGNDWGWSAPATLAALTGSVLALGLFALLCARHPNPLVDGALFRVRAFTGASVVAALFSIAFGAMLLSVVLWDQEVWGWSALQTGLAVAPGPLMVPLFSFLVAGRMIARFGPGPVIGVGAGVFGLGVLWWALATTTRPDYAGEMLGGMLVTGIGVGLTLPTFMATGAASLPPQSFATGSAVVNMLRQVGLAVGVALLVAVLGTPAGAAAQRTAFHQGWVLIAAVAFVSGLAGVLVLGARRPASAGAPRAEPVAAGRTA